MVRAVFAVVLLASTLAFPFVEDGDLLDSLPIDSKLVAKSDILIPAKVKKVYFRDGKRMFTGWAPSDWGGEHHCWIEVSTASSKERALRTGRALTIKGQESISIGYLSDKECRKQTTLSLSSKSIPKVGCANVCRYFRDKGSEKVTLADFKKHFGKFLELKTEPPEDIGPRAILE